MWMSRSSGTGAVMTWSCGPRTWRSTVSPYWSTLICAVVGVTPSVTMRLPASALMNALLPELNSPTMTRRKSSSS